jgi:hypothetical protein
MHMLDTSFIQVCTVWQVTRKDKGNAYDKTMKFVQSCILGNLPTEPSTTCSALQQVYTLQHLSELISYLVGYDVHCLSYDIIIIIIILVY